MSGNGTLSTPSFHKAQRQALVADMMARSMSLAMIAKRLDIDREVVAHDVSEIVSRWEQDTKRSVSQLVAGEVAKLNRLELECWRQWERTKRSKDGGDPRYLREIRGIIDQRAKFLGLHAPKRQQVRIEGQQQPEWMDEIDRISAASLARVGAEELGRAFGAAAQDPSLLLDVSEETD